MIILDTHTWIWLTSDPEKLSSKARENIKKEKSLGVSAISCWEFATLIEKGRITVDRSPLEWIEQSIGQHQLQLVPLTPAIAVRSTQLGPGFHGDPADRIIAATTLVSSATLVTKDKRLRDYSTIPTIW